MKAKEIRRQLEQATEKRKQLNKVAKDLSAKKQVFEEEHGSLQILAAKIPDQRSEANGKHIAGEISEAKLAQIIAEFDDTERRIKELKAAIESCRSRIRTANNEIAADGLDGLRSQYRETVLNDHREALVKDKSFILKLQELSVMCDITQFHEGQTLEGLCGETADVRSMILKKFEKAGIALDLL